MNIILTKKIFEIDEFSTYFKKLTKERYGWEYVFELFFYLDNLDKYRGLGKKSKEKVEEFLTKYFDPIQQKTKELEQIMNSVSELEIKDLKKVANSRNFKKLNSFFLELHHKGFSNRTVLTSLVGEEVGILYKFGANSMNTGVFLETFKKAKEKDKMKLLNYIKSLEKMFQKIYREEILKQLKSG